MNIKDAYAGMKDFANQMGGVGKELREKAANVRDTARVINAKDGSPAPVNPNMGGPSKGDKVNPNAKYGDRPGESRDAAKPPVFHKGGKVRKTGVIRAKKGERVLTVAQTNKMDKKGLAKVLGGK